MPTRPGTKTCFPRFEAIVSTKVEHGTYDMNDEEHTDHSFPNSTVPSETASTDLALMEAMGAAEGKMPTGTQPVVFTINTNRICTNTKEKEDEVAESPTHSDNKSSIDNLAVSWSDSDGSTYISENDPEIHSFGSHESATNNAPTDLREEKTKCSEKSEKSGETFDDLDIGDESVQKYPEPSVKIKLKEKRMDATIKEFTISSGTNSTLRGRDTHKNPHLLENVDYYAAVDIASTNDGISVVKFISKEDTRDIFCRRLVPLEIPVRKRRVQDDVSEFSSEKTGSVMPTGEALSTQAVYTKRGTAPRQQQKDKINQSNEPVPSNSRPLKNDDHLSNVEVQSQNIEFSTVTCRISSQDAVSAFDKRDEATRDYFTNEESSIRVPRLVVKVSDYQNLDKLSSLGSESATSKDHLEDFVGSVDEDEMEMKPVINSLDGGNSEITPSYDPNMISEPTPRLSNLKVIVAENLGERVELKAKPKMCDRIRVLKARIQKMKEKSDFETLSEQRLRSDYSKESTGSRVSKVMNVSKMKRKQLEDQISTSSDRDHAKQRRKPAHARARDDDLEKRLQLQDLDFVAETRLMLDNIAIVSVTETSKSSERHSAVPSEVTPVLDELDDVSTIHCDFDHLYQRTELNDLELGYVNDESGMDCQKTNNFSWRKNVISVECLQAAAQKGTTLARQANCWLEGYASYRHLRAFVVGLWMKYIDGRSRTEQAMIGVMFLSFFSFIILLVSIFSG